MVMTVAWAVTLDRDPFEAFTFMPVLACRHAAAGTGVFHVANLSAYIPYLMP